MATYNGHNEDSSGNILLSIGNGMTATVETGTTASQAYIKGSYLFFNNRLCKATSAISSGATLAIGTNLSQTSIGQEITSHLRASDGKEFYFDVKDGTYGYYPSASKTASEFVPFGGTLSSVYLFDRVFNSTVFDKSYTLPHSSSQLVVSFSSASGGTMTDCTIYKNGSVLTYSTRQFAPHAGFTVLTDLYNEGFSSGDVIRIVAHTSPASSYLAATIVY